MSSRHSAPSAAVISRRNASKRCLNQFLSMLGDAKKLPIDCVKECIDRAVAYLREALKGVVEVFIRSRNAFTSDIFLGHPAMDDWHGHVVLKSSANNPCPRIVAVRHYGQSKRSARKALKRR